MAENKRCPTCGLELPANAAQNFCPACLLRQGMESDALSLAHPGEPGVTAPWIEGVTHRSVLDILRNAVGAVPNVLLRDPEPAMESPQDRASSSEAPEHKGRYQILGEIDRGGMGAVLRGHDLDLGRDLAIKVLLEEHHDDPVMTRRFVEEAQIGGQLQHPGIVPVYELGSFDDRRPYFTMKLVKGRTMAALLRERAGPVHDLPRFLSIFEQVCQTMAYAHARGVIHRDLKPLNIMVGAFGEVQVMDWGLAKVLPKGGTNDETRPQTDDPAASVICTVRPGSGVGESRGVSVRGGTPAYMAPEQANDDVEAMDARADVFGLGSILCQILTGRPAYTGQSTDAILRKARRGDTADAWRRLDGCGAGAELVGLARDCLAADPDERPREAGEVARRMTAYFAGVQDRLRAAELARAAEEARAEEARATAAEAERARAAEQARAEEAQNAAMAADGRARAERRARMMTVGMAASVLIAAAIGAVGWRWTERNRLVRLAAITGRVNTSLQEATGLRGQAQWAAVGDLLPWTKALAAAEKARELLEPGVDLSLRSQAEDLLARITTEKNGAEAAARARESDRVLLDKLVDIRSAKIDDPEGSISDRACSESFGDAGIDVAALPPVDAGARIRARPELVAAALVAALDDWAAVRRRRSGDLSGALRLSEAANAADPDPWRVGLRRVLNLADRASRKKALRELAASTKDDTAPAVDLQLLGDALFHAGERNAAEEVLRAGQMRFPSDVWLNYALASLLRAKSRREEAIRYYSIARALRPETAHELAHLLNDEGESAQAIAVYRDLVRLRPDAARHWDCYGKLLKERGEVSESTKALSNAVAILQRKTRTKRSTFDSVNLGIVLHALGKLDEAVAELRRVVLHVPNFAEAHASLGQALIDQGKLTDAFVEYQDALRLKPDVASWHNGLGRVLRLQWKLREAAAEFNEAIRLSPDWDVAHANLGIVLLNERKLVEATAACREAIRLNPESHAAHAALGDVLLCGRRYEEAIAEFKSGIRVNPAYAYSHAGLGSALFHQGKLKEAIAAYREAVLIEPNNARFRSDLSNSLRWHGELEEAVKESREATRRTPESPEAHYYLANALRDRNQIDESIAEFQTAIRLKPDYAEARTNLGCIFFRQGKLAEAIAEFREALRAEPDLIQARQNLALALGHQGKLNQSISKLRSTIGTDPDDARSRDILGVVLNYQGKHAEAIAEFRDATRLQPRDARPHEHLASALVSLPHRPQGDYEEGLIHARQARDLAPDDGGCNSTLALAEYRVGHWAESLAAGERSMERRRGGYASDWLLHGMARWKSGDRDKARDWIDRAAARISENEPWNVAAFWIVE